MRSVDTPAAATGASPAAAVTGVSVLSSIGGSLGAITESLQKRRSGLTKNHRFRDLIDAPLGEVPLVEGPAGASRLERLAHRLICELDVSTRLFSKAPPGRIGLFIGTTTAGLERWYEETEHHAAPGRARGEAWRGAPAMLLNARDQLGSITAFLKREFPIRGFDAAYATACSAGAVALAKAREALAMGLVDYAIAGGLDVLTPMTIMGFDALQILDHNFCRPFQADRRGLNLAEGGAFFLLEREDGPTLGKDAPLARFIGAGAASDAHHMTHPDPEGRGMELCMRRALLDAGIADGTGANESIDYINAHGTGTLPNDATESAAITRIFGGVPFSSTKELHGHALGGAGAIEAAVAIAALQAETAWLVPTVRPVHRVLSNSFGFGGNNAALLFGKGADR